MAARRPFWKRHRWKSIGFCLWPPSTCIWSLKLKFQSKLDLCSGNHVVYRQTDGQTDRRTRWIQYTPPPTSLGGGITSCAHKWGQYTPALITTHLIQKYPIKISILQSYATQVGILQENEARNTKMYRGQETHPIRINARYEMNWANSFFKNFRKPHFRPNIWPPEGRKWC